MNPADQSQLEALLSAYGHSPFGRSGYGHSFGDLPGTTYMPPGGFMGGSTFFGPQIPNPHHLSFGDGLIGRMAGYGAERYAGSVGMQYLPRGVNVVDAMQGRHFERGLTQAGDLGRQFDEQRLARAIEMGFSAALSSQGRAMTPQHSATANALAAVASPGLSQMGFMRYLPGGSAESFAQQMFAASQNMRDYTRSEYALGVPTTDANAMTRRLMSFFMPTPGVVDPMQTRGMGLGDIGRMAGTLTSYGLVQTDVSKKELRTAADELGYNLDELTGPETKRLTDLTRSRNVGQQLQSYAELFGVLREIMGDPDAPIPKMVESLQQLTGGKFQAMQPGQMQQMLFKIKETARASNIAMDTMMETLIAASQQNQAMGGSGLGGAQMALSAYSSATAAQTVTQGAFSGRMSPGRMANLELARTQRGRLSANTRINAQAVMLAEEMSAGPGLTDTQKQELTAIRQEAMGGNFTLQGQNDLIRRFASLGVSPDRARNALQSDVGVQDWLEANPEFDKVIRSRQDRELRADFVGAVKGRFLGSMGTDSNDQLVQQLDQSAAASNMTGEQLLGKLGQAYFHTARGTVEEMDAWLKTQGVDTSGINLDAFYGDLERSKGMQRRFKGLGVSDRAELAQQYGEPARVAQRRHEKRIRAATAGQAMLSDINAEMRGGALDRIVGAVSEGATSLEEITMAAFGMKPTEEIQQALGEKWASDMTELHRKYAAETDPVEKEKLAAQMREKVQAASEFAPGGSMAGIDRTKGTQQILSTLNDDVLDAARKLQDTSADKSERLQAAQTVTTALQKLDASGAYEDVMSELSGPQQEAFDFQRTMMSMDAGTLQSQLDKLKDPNLSSEDRERIERRILGEGGTMLGGGVVSMQGGVGQLQRRLKGRARGSRRDLRDKMGLVRELNDLAQKFASAEGEDKQVLLGQLQEASMDALGSGLFTLDEETGEARPNEEFIRLTTLLNKDTRGDADAATEAADKSRDELGKLFRVASRAAEQGAAGDASDAAAKEIGKLIDEEGSISLDHIKLPGGRTLTDLQRMEANTQGVKTGADAKRAIQIGNRIDQLQGALSKRSPSGYLSGYQSRVVGRMISSISGDELLYDKQGLLTDEAVSTIISKFTNREGDVDWEGATRMISTLDEAGTLKGMDADERAKYVREKFGADKAAKDADDKSSAPGTGGDDDAAGGFRLVDADTGETLKEIEVRRVAAGAGREASKTQSRKSGWWPF